MSARALPDETVLKANWAHPPKAKIFLEYSKKEIVKLYMLSGSLRCKNITTSSKDLLKESDQNVLLDVPLEKSEGEGKVILVGAKGNFHGKVIPSTNLKTRLYPQEGSRIDGKDDQENTVSATVCCKRTAAFLH